LSQLNLAKELLIFKCLAIIVSNTKTQIDKENKIFFFLKQTIDAIILEKIKIAISIKLKNNNLSINCITINNVCISKRNIYC